jgi:small subunit ribosomal protein S17
MSEKKKVSRSITGRVVSNKMDKTVTVQIERKVSHPLYQKYVRRSTRISAHDEKNECNEGDLVMIEQCRPLSKNKSWRLVKVLEHTG